MKDWRARVIDAFFVRVVERFATALVHALIHGNTVASNLAENLGYILTC